MKHDKRRNEPPEERRNWQDRQIRKEERQSDWGWAQKLDRDEDPLVSVASAISKVKEDLTKLSGIIATPGGSGMIGKSFSYVYMDELPETLPKRVPDYVSDTSWDGWKPEPKDHRGKQKKKWHSIQYKAYKKWNADAELREAVEAEIVGEARQDLGWGGF